MPDLHSNESVLLDVAYSGTAWRATAPLSDDTFDLNRVGQRERIGGAFKVVERLGAFAVLDNGERPPGRWVVFAEDLDV